MNLSVILNIISQLNKIPIYMINDSEDIENFCNENKYNSIQKWLKPTNLKKQINRLGKEDILEVNDPFEIRFIILKINSHTIIIGPYISKYLSRFEAESMLKRNGISSDYVSDFLVYRDKIFSVSNDRIYSLITILHDNLSETPLNFNYIVVNPETNENNEISFEFNNSEASDYYKNKKLFFEAVKNANAKKAIEIWNKISIYFNREKIELTKLSAIEYITIIKIAAYEAGLPDSINEKLSNSCKEALIQAERNSTVDKEVEKLIKTYSKYIEDIVFKSYSAITLEVKYLFENEYENNLIINDIANYYNVSPNYLINQFKKDLSITPNQYLNKVRINNAKILLLTRKSSIANIASEVGISDPNYFTKLFKKYTNETPNEYRKNRI